jgi:predicted GIY-YIG superfamily endonuclease
MADNRISYGIITGAPSMVNERITSKVSAYIRAGRVRKFWIGTTSKPERRFAQRYARKYDRMIVVYRTSSKAFARQVEKRLIKHYRRVAANRIRGGGGDIGGPPYFLYIVLRY